MELELMNADITTLQQQQLMEDTVVQSTTDTALQAENGKLTYQLNHLKRNYLREKFQQSTKSLVEEQKKERSSSVSILRLLEDTFRMAIMAAFPDLTSPLVLITQSTKSADYQCNSAMQIAGILSANSGKKVTAMSVAQSIVKHLPPTDAFNKVDIGGQGFINIFLSQSFVLHEIGLILRYGVLPPAMLCKKRIVVDFSSPNIAKEMHVGHLRSTIIGDSVCRLLEWVGHDVVRTNHLGDWGTQFGMLIAHLQDTFPAFMTQPPPISDLQILYKESKQRFDADEEFRKRAYDCVVRLQTYEPTCFKTWQMICEISTAEFSKVYKRLDICLTEKGESFYQERMKGMMKDLIASGEVSKDEVGRWVMFVPNYKVPLIMTKSDGAYTYDTSDVACIHYRLRELNADWILYVVDMGQAIHLNTVFMAAKMLGWLSPAKHRVEHIGFGVVLGEDKKKFKTRSGDTVRLSDLLNEGVKRALSKLQEKGQDMVLSEAEMERATTAVAYGCIKYADLSHNRTKDYVFSFDKMLDDKGNTAAYLLYALTRIRSIIRTARLSQDDLLRAASGEHSLLFTHEHEWKLAKCLLRLPEVVVRMLDDFYLHPLCEYLYEVSTTFSEFYETCYCVVKDNDGNITQVNMSRLLLCEATARTFVAVFNILGVTPLDRM